MEIRTLYKDEREALLELLDMWELPDGWRGRDFFRRYIEIDPSYADDNVWVASDDGRLVSCVQIFPRLTRLLDHDVPTGGIGSVFTHPEWRRSGIAGSVLDRAGLAMQRRGMEISLLFSARNSFYEKHGYREHKTHRTVLRWSDRSATESAAAEVSIEPFRANTDVEAVRELHQAYSSGRTGTTTRDTALWQASFELAGNPAEDFVVARSDGSIVAYCRATLLNDVFQVTELGRSEQGAGALAQLVMSLMHERKPDILAPPGKSSREMRSFVILPTFDDIQLTVALEQNGVASHPLEDPATMLRCLDAEALARRIGTDLLPDEESGEFLQRILPPGGLVFWPADRF